MKLAAIVLAAGKAERFGGGKLQASFQGEPLLNHALRAALAAPVAEVILVGREPDPAVFDPRLREVIVPGDALSVSLRAGLAAASAADGVLIFLGDMPLIPHDMAAKLADAIGPALAVIPEYLGRPGHPVLLSRKGFDLAGRLEGDEGLGMVLRGREDVLRLPVEDEGVVLDVDRPEDLAALAKRLA